MLAQTVDGDLDAADASCDEIDAIKHVTGHPLPPYGRMFLAAYRGQAEEVERRAEQIRADGEARGEGYALSAANFAEAILYNGLGRYDEAVAAARRELPYTHELSHAMRSLLELVEAATRTGERELGRGGVRAAGERDRAAGERLGARRAGHGEAQLHEGDEAEALFLEAIERFERGRIPIMVGRTPAALRRDAAPPAPTSRRPRTAPGRARAALRAGPERLRRRAARELRRHRRDACAPARPRPIDQLTDQELNVARLAREGLTNRDIGGRLFISARTAEYHLRKVFMKLGDQLTRRAQVGARQPRLSADGARRSGRPTGARMSASPKAPARRAGSCRSPLGLDGSEGLGIGIDESHQDLADDPPADWTELIAVVQDVGLPEDAEPERVSPVQPRSDRPTSSALSTRTARRRAMASPEARPTAWLRCRSRVASDA